MTGNKDNKNHQLKNSVLIYYQILRLILNEMCGNKENVLFQGFISSEIHENIAHDSKEVKVLVSLYNIALLTFNI